MAQQLAIVTGTATGLGYYLAQGLIQRGFVVAGLDYNANRQKEISAQWGEQYIPFVGDISDEAFVKEAVAHTAQHGHIDLLINNAGQPSFKVPTAYTGDDITRCLKGLEGMILCSTQVLIADHERDVTIANVMSTAATRGNAHEAVYCAAKWGEKGYTESLKAAYKGSSVRIIGIYPGGIDTPFYVDSKDYVDDDKQHTFMDPAELADVLLYNLLTDKKLMVSDIRIDRLPA